MALTIQPAGSGSRGAWTADVFIFFLGVFAGSLASGALVVAIIGTAGLFFDGAIIASALAGLIMVMALRDLGLRIPARYRSKQVPEWWRDALSPRSVLVAFGVMLGFGFATPFASAAHMAFLMTIPYLPSTGAVVVCLICFSLGKTLVLQMGVGAASHADVIDRISGGESSGGLRRIARRLVSVGGSAAIVMLLLQKLMI